MCGCEEQYIQVGGTAYVGVKAACAGRKNSMCGCEEQHVQQEEQHAQRHKYMK